MRFMFQSDPEDRGPRSRLVLVLLIVLAVCLVVLALDATIVDLQLWRAP